MTSKWFTLLAGVALLVSTASCDGKKKKADKDDDDDDKVEMAKGDDDKDLDDMVEDALFPDNDDRDDDDIDDKDDRHDDDVPDMDDGYNDDIDDDVDPYPFLRQRKITDADLAYADGEQLEKMRNYIFARHGYRFKRDDLFRYFSQFDWYHPVTSDMAAIYSELSETEKYNIEFIRKRELP
jgi:hypothetical protein